MGVSSSRKGSAFERKIARELSHWLGSDKPVIWRSAGSGAAALQVKDKTKSRHYCADLMSIDPLSQAFIDAFYCELKDYKKLEAHKLFTRSGFLWKEWLDVIRQAQKFDKHPMLIGHQTFWDTLVMITRPGANALNVSTSPFDKVGNALILPLGAFVKVVPPLLA